MPVILPSTVFRRCPRYSRYSRYSRFPRPSVPTGWGSPSIRIEEVANRCRSTPRSFPRGSRTPFLLPGTAPGRRPVGHGRPGECVSSAVFRSECRGHRAVDSSRMVGEARGNRRRRVGTIVRPREKNEGEWRRACKPGSVESGHFSGMPVARHLERSTRESQRTGPARQGSLLDLAPGGVYQAEPVTRFAGALLPHRFTLTSWDSEESPIGGLISVALSLSSRTVGVTHHRVLWSPDFPPRGRLRKAPTQRPLGPLRLPLCRSL